MLLLIKPTATTAIYTLSLHDALPISAGVRDGARRHSGMAHPDAGGIPGIHRFRDFQDVQLLERCDREVARLGNRSEEHTSELQSLRHLVCRLLLEKKKTQYTDRKEPA